MRFFVLLAVLLLPVPATAANWIQIHFSFSDLQAFYVDKESIFKQNDGNLRVWVKKEEMPIKVLCESGCEKHPDPQGCKKLFQENCRGGSGKYNKLTLYEVSCTGQMRTLRSETGEEKIGDWFYVVPGSLSALVEKEACKK